jgi:undecaprenyl-diphosphatase
MSQYLIEFAASFFIWFMYLGLVVLWIIDGRIKKEQVVHALSASLIALLVAAVLKSIFHTARPFIVQGLTPLTLTVPSDAAFPSSHTAMAFALSITIWLHDRKVGWIYLIWALFVGIARILANVHYPIDIWGGAILGIVIAFGLEKVHLFNFIKRYFKK